ncbi:PH domain-containing protein [Curtobacterium sp. MCBA15_004]|uniref:PH domain-containing protein n=1 Tax=unclassified Curtobacterium TaxID=257496 RepID=UPI0008DD4159|nr:PH domain-containing protein [Curtobacterium sp. MCBA15_004]WIA97710.1 PH domain-containing protein [Curtobacterium sp. MCBA15_004]
MASGLVVVLGVLLLADAAARGSWDVVLVALGPVAAAVWVTWVATVRPCIRFDDDAVTVVNPLRTTRVPWPAVRAVRQRWQVLVDTVDGRTVTCRGGPALPRRRPGAGGPADAPAVRPLLDRFAERRRVAGSAGPDAPVETTWDRVPVVLGAVVGVLLVVSIVTATVTALA